MLKLIIREVMNLKNITKTQYLGLAVYIIGVIILIVLVASADVDKITSYLALSSICVSAGLAIISLGIPSIVEKDKEIQKLKKEIEKLKN